MTIHLTHASPLATITISALADLAQLALNDSGATIWPQATIQSWVVEGIRDYEAAFPRVKTITYVATTGLHKYTLPQDLRKLLSLQYPTSQDPPQFLAAYDRHLPSFWQAGTAFYDVEHSRDAQTASTLWISIHPPTTPGSMELYYQAQVWDYTSVPPTVCVVPDHHLPLIVAFVVYKALQELLFREISTADPGQGQYITDIRHYRITAVATAADDARNRYDAALTNAKAQDAEAYPTAPWNMNQPVDQRVAP